ncbi:phospholipase A2 inhibitor NAI-like [Anolis sagrei]|uniref:phospholipase A2 inhibitor NAI-like n=1 Tax=Anolis sagrei TaxID=38937 RepID=UPI003520DAA1
MQAILGLFIISAFLTAGTALECETCVGVGMPTCTGKNMSCQAGYDTCATIVTEITIGDVSSNSVTKTCIPKSACTTEMPNIQIPDAVTVTRIECHNNASPAAVSFLCLSGLLLMKMIL